MASYMGHEYTPAPAQAVQGRYRVGDRVRVVKDGHEDGGSGHGADIGEVTTIKEAVDSDFVIGDSGWAFTPHEISPAFRPGDRVKLNKHSGMRACGERGTVSAVLGDNVSVRMDDASVYGTVVAFFHADKLDWERVEDCVPVTHAHECARRKDEQPNNVETLTIKLGLDTTDFDIALADLQAAVDGPCIVARVDELTAPWGTKATKQPRPSQWPHVHPDSASAIAEAERLARNNPGQEFAVYQRVAGRRAEVSVEMKEVA